MDRTFQQIRQIVQRIQQAVDRQIELGMAEGAAETAQIWNAVCGILDQIIRVIGSEKISNVQLREMISTGLQSLEIGLVPSAADCVIIGTLQRTRLSKSPILIVTGANEGVLPMSGGDNGLLTERELELLEDLKYTITKRDEVRRQEEQLAIYRMFSLPSEHLFVMCSLADQDGRSITPSAVFSVLAELEGVSVLGDLGKLDVFEQIASRKGSLAFMADAMQGYLENGRIDEAWLAAMNWYEKQDPDSISKIMQGLDFDHRVSRLEADFADSLYFGDRDSMNVSASRLETYSSCPFRYFIEKGLRAEDPDAFETSGGSRGDVFHKALQVLSARLTEVTHAAGLTVTDPDSPWMTITEDDCKAQVESIIREETAGYREGVYLSDNETKLQLEKIITTCSEIAWAMIGQVRKSRVKDMFFEEPFGTRSKRLAPIEIELERGKKAVLSGIIDRLDIIDVPAAEESGDPAAAGDSGDPDDSGAPTAPGDACDLPTSGGFDAVRVVDYKTGQDEINLDHIREGYKLQLMVYMNVAGQSADSDMKPAGVFYFKIKELEENADKKTDTASLGRELEDRIAKSCRLEGIMVRDENILRAMDGTIAPTETSTVLPLKQNKDGEIKQTASGELLSSEEFDELCNLTMEHVRQICQDIQSGRIDIEPKKEKGSSGRYTKTSCRYCAYKSICLFDTSFRSCRYKLV